MPEDPGEPEWDDWERAIWRAYQLWLNTRCPHCGNDLADCTKDEHPEGETPRWVAGFDECRATEVLEMSKQRQQEIDEKARTSRGQEAPPTITAHRRWRVWRDDEKGW